MVSHSYTLGLALAQTRFPSGDNYHAFLTEQPQNWLKYPPSLHISPIPLHPVLFFLCILTPSLPSPEAVFHGTVSVSPHLPSPACTLPLSLQSLLCPDRPARVWHPLQARAGTEDLCAGKMERWTKVLTFDSRRKTGATSACDWGYPSSRSCGNTWLTWISWELCWEETQARLNYMPPCPSPLPHNCSSFWGPWGSSRHRESSSSSSL